MDKQEQNNIIKSSIVKVLREGQSVPDDIGETYRNWVLGIANKANADVQQNAAQNQEEQQSPGQ